jgi:Zn-dependent peptidase ImmA (M78 family)
MPLDELLPFSVGHELGHALCEEVDEKKANEYGAQFRDMATIRCVPR